jgi:hypothetical protein
VDEHFSRKTHEVKLEDGITINVMVDTLNADDLKCCYISIDLPVTETLELVFEGFEQILQCHGRLIADEKRELLYWIPKEPVLRDYDDQERIERQNKAEVTVSTDTNDVMYSIKGGEAGSVEFCILTFAKNIETFANELSNFAPVETRKVIKSFWFHYERPADIWDYFINGRILSIRHLGRIKPWHSKNLVFAFYYHLEFLCAQTNKYIYRLFGDLIAYSLMVSLPDDGRWRHGSWTDLMETHTVHQITGIHVLLSYYERTKREIFLQKAKQAVDFLIDLAEELPDNGIWFMHDTLETSIDDVRLGYKNLVPSRAFGKSESNTLCINTHIATMMVLDKINQVDPTEQYKEYFDRGLITIKKVLTAKPCTLLYYCLYRLRDVIVKINLKHNNNFTKDILKKYNILLRRYILPFLNKTFPRIVIPNGYIERDISASNINTPYHFITLRDMLKLYSRVKEDWLKKILSKSIKYTTNSSIIEEIGLQNPKASSLQGIMLLYSSMIDEQYLRFLPEYIAGFQKNNIPLTMDVVSNPEIVNSLLPVTVNDSEVVVLLPANNDFFDGVIINPSQKGKTVRLESVSEKILEKFELLDDNNRRHPSMDNFSISPLGCIKIVRKNEQG